MTSQPGKQVIAMHILSNISRRKRQSDNDIWSVNKHEKYFSWKVICKMWWRNYSQTLFQKIKIFTVLWYNYLVNKNVITSSAKFYHVKITTSMTIGLNSISRRKEIIINNFKDLGNDFRVGTGSSLAIGISTGHDHKNSKIWQKFKFER